MCAPKTCPHCGAAVPRGWETCTAAFEQVLTREYTDAAYGATHLLSVDAYALQHSGGQPTRLEP
jgi:predicted nucleic acid-binding Zn ribbon protein